MRVGIMQPYFLPYIGYWQLISAVDKFVVYDNIKYTKKGWINRNRILVNGRSEFITLPLRHDSDYLDVCDRYLSDSFDTEKWKSIMIRIAESYRKAPFYWDVYPLVEEIVSYNNYNLFLFIFNSINKIKEYLEIKTPLIKSSSVLIDHHLKGQDKVLAICESLGANQYINAIGGLELYNKEVFNERHIQLNFIKADRIVYMQLGEEFVPWLSILDVMMFNSKERIQEMLCRFILV